MGDSAGNGPRLLAAMVVAAGLAVMTLQAWAVSAQLSAQFHRVEEFIQLVRPDGTPYDTTLTNDVWTQTFGISHARRFGNATTVSSDFRWIDSYYVGQVSRTQTPSLRLSVTNPVYGFTTSYQPSQARVALSPLAGFGGGGVSAPVEVGTARSQRLQLAGFLALPALPRVDLSWERNHRSALSLSPQQTSVSRSARIAHSIGPVAMRLGYSDVARGIATAGVPAPYQSSWDAQAGFGIRPRADLSLSTQYTFSTLRRTVAGFGTDRNSTHGVNVGGGYLPRKDVSVDLAYAFRHGELSRRQRFVTDTHDGSLGLRYHPIPIASLGVAGALRTNTSQGIANVTRSLVGTAQLAGRVRRGWDADATATHAWSWDRYSHGVTLDNLSGRSRFELRRSLSLVTDGQLSFTNAITTSGERVVATTSTALIARPFRILDLSASLGGYRSGPTLSQATSRSRSRTADMTLRASRTLILQAGVSQTGAQPNNSPRTGSSRCELRWQPSGSMSLATVYTRSTSQQSGAFTSQLQGRESLASRWSAALGRSIQLGAGIALTDPGATSESRQYDATVTKTFGR